MKFLPAALLPLFMLASCTSSRRPAKQEPVVQSTALATSLASKQLEGIDFFAKGNTPATWALEIDFGNLIRFNPLDDAAVTSTAVQPQFLPEQNAAVYTSKATNGDIVIHVKNEPCTDLISGDKFDKKVTITVNDKRYEGCGQYLFDARIDGKWILQKINNQNLLASDFAKGLPAIHLALEQRKLAGHDGCNNLGGTFELLGSKIKFGPLALTKMACPGNKAGNEIAALLSGQIVDYYFTNGQLFFYLQDDSILVFDRG